MHSLFALFLLLDLCAYIYIFLSISYLISIMLIIYVFRTDHLVLGNQRCALSWRILFLHSQHSLVARSSLYRFETLWACPCLLWHGPRFAHFGIVMLVILYECIFWYYEDTQYHHTFGTWRFLQSFHPFFHNVPRILAVGMFWGCIHWDWAPHSAF